MFGADARIAIPYDDPKASDGTEHEAQTYDERCRQIAREKLYAFREARSLFPRPPSSMAGTSVLPVRWQAGIRENRASPLLQTDRCRSWLRLRASIAVDA